MPTSNNPPFTPEATIGPFFPFAFTEVMPGSAAVPGPGLSQRPDGRPVVLAGRILASDGIGVRNMILESWQANAHGRYRHPDDRSDRPIDPSFQGFIRVRTSASGQFRLETIKPGAHPCADGSATRAPHLRLTVFGSGIDRLVTFVYFDDEAQNAGDPVLASLEEPLRARLIARRCADDDGDGFTGYRLDLVLRGEDETPFFDDWST